MTTPCEATPKSWKCEVCVQGEWSSNGCRYATQTEALLAGAELLSRWYVPTEYRSVPSDDAVNYEFSDGRPQPLKVTP